jgi:hypothetical protein
VTGRYPLHVGKYTRQRTILRRSFNQFLFQAIWAGNFLVNPTGIGVLAEKQA